MFAPPVTQKYAWVPEESGVSIKTYKILSRLLEFGATEQRDDIQIVVI